MKEADPSLVFGGQYYSRRIVKAFRKVDCGDSRVFRYRVYARGSAGKEVDCEDVRWKCSEQPIEGL